MYPDSPLLLKRNVEVLIFFFFWIKYLCILNIVIHSTVFYKRNYACVFFCYNRMIVLVISFKHGKNEHFSKQIIILSFRLLYIFTNFSERFSMFSCSRSLKNRTRKYVQIIDIFFLHFGNWYGKKILYFE